MPGDPIVLHFAGATTKVKPTGTLALNETSLKSTALRKADALLFAVNLIGLAWAALAAWLDWGVWAAYTCVGITSALYLSHVRWHGDSILKRLLVFGIAGGVVELAADWWLVSITKTLQYTPAGPFLIDSPAYMPLSWAGILLSMGWLGWLVERRHGMAAGILAAGAAAGIYVPAFEALAHYANWWTYDGCAMLGVVPWYIIVGEFLVGAAMPPLVKHVLADRGFVAATIAGAAAGLWIWAAYVVAMAVT